MKTADAISGPETVYDAVPSVTPHTNYASLGYEATSTSEFGDSIHLGGTNRTLNTVTVTMSDWAKYEDYASNPSFNASTSTWSWPITLNVFTTQVDGNGVPTTKLGSITQSVSIPWRPASDPSCGSTNNGNGWKEGGDCFNYSGIAFDASFDFSSQHIPLPDDVIVSVAYDTQHYGSDPTGAPTPANSLNVAIPEGQTTSVGTDVSSNNIFWDSTYGGRASGLKEDTDWSPNGTVAFKVTADSPVTISPCVTTNSVVTTDLSTWNLSETRSTGHNQLVADGLHVWTEGATSTDKAAGYYPASFKLADLGEGFGLEATTISGNTPPALQLTTDLDGNGSLEGNLVAEPGAYGPDTLWLSSNWTGIDLSNAPTTVNGGGTGKGGTVNAWLAAYPNAKVYAIGYSLGSGVHGDYTITKLTAGCTDYTFQLAPPAVPTNLRFENPSIPCGGSTNINQTTAAWDAVAGAASYDYHVDGPNGLTYDTNLTGTSNTGSFGAGDEGTYTFKVRSVSSGGAKSDWSSSCSITYDPTAPTTPTLLTPPNGSFVDTNDFYFTWTSSTDNSPVTYEFLASQNPHTTGGVLDTGTWDSIANGNSEQNNLTTPQIHSTGAPDGDWFWQVRAIDAAGNKSNWTGVWKVTIDTQTPQVPTNLGWKTSTNVTVPDSGSTNVVDGTASWQDSSSDIDHYVYKYWNDISGNPYKENSPYTTTTGSTSLYGVFNQGEGVHHFAVSACDAAAHCSAFSAPFTITYDASAPTGLANVSPTDGTHTTTANQSEITWTAASDISGPISYYYESSHSNATQGDGSFASPVYQSGALSTNSINTPNTPAGTYYWHVRACDTVGNCTAWTDAWQLIVDNSAPQVTINSYSGTDTTPTVTGTVDDPTSSLTLKVDSGTPANATNNGDGTWTYTLPTALSVGSHTLEVTATDTAGNHSSATATATVQAPAASVQGLTSSNGRGNSNNAPGHQPTVTITPNNTGQVLGATTTDSKKSDVKGASTTKTDEPTVNFANANDTKKAGSQSAFLMLGWWWLLVVAGVLTAWWLLATRRGSEQN